MKKIVSILLFCFLAFTATAQTYTGDRIVARGSLYLKDYWISKIQRDTGYLVFGDASSVPTSKAVQDYIDGKLAAYLTSASLSGFVPKVNPASTLWTMNHINSATIYDGNTLSRFSGSYYDGTTEKSYA